MSGNLPDDLRSTALAAYSYIPAGTSCRASILRSTLCSKKGGSFAPNEVGGDTFQTVGDRGTCTSGDITINGDAVFYESGSKTNDSIKNNPNTTAGLLLSTTTIHNPKDFGGHNAGELHRMSQSIGIAVAQTKQLMCNRASLLAMSVFLTCAFARTDASEIIAQKKERVIEVLTDRRTTPLQFERALRDAEKLQVNRAFWAKIVNDKSVPPWHGRHAMYQAFLAGSRPYDLSEVLTVPGATKWIHARDIIWETTASDLPDSLKGLDRRDGEIYAMLPELPLSNHSAIYVKVTGVTEPRHLTGSLRADPDAAFARAMTGKGDAKDIHVIVVGISDE